MILRGPLILALLLAIVAILAGVALLIPGGGEKMVARASTKQSAQPLRDCLAAKLGLTWSGDPKAMHASAFGLRVVVGDSGASRQVGLFTAGGRALSSGESSAVKACLDGQ